ncbi:hypothetical protein FC52_GL001783 [Lactobacillus pasteurii DSM 23907 = CRBIP 24.76]|uniref:Cell surface protein n=1 Tax=Lactobacillus pasteurii DSM 23907 = CRBIP 24.76 TaxID=1423790 RepID=I7KKT4_9LACO|nr:hypothetical protein FC52_GL001783 [Lactobacillus pasteurii DSM 23907 = CRBIP 24.76]TDG77040.1 hypothetical protein C5L33_000683 [Lactobacillus pasteurii]CCI84784.1 Cell surface protein [Lactobacillus pasteurii DSM 23907 = CRBIP 24.76]
MGLASVALATTILGVTGNKQVQAADTDANTVPAEGAEKTNKADQTYDVAPTKTVKFMDGSEEVDSQTITGVQIKGTDKFEYPTVVAQIPDGYESTTKMISADTLDTIAVTKKKDTTPTTPSTDTKKVYFVYEDGTEAAKSVNLDGFKEAPFIKGYEADEQAPDKDGNITYIYRKLASKDDKTIYSSNPTDVPTNPNNVDKTKGQDINHNFNIDFKLVDDAGNIKEIKSGKVEVDQSFYYAYTRDNDKGTTEYLDPKFSTTVEDFLKGLNISAEYKEGKLLVNGLPLKTVQIGDDKYDVVYVTHEYHMGTDGKEGLKYTDVDTANIDDKTYYNFIKTHGYDPKNGDLGNKDTFNLVYNPSTSAAGYMPTIASMSNNTVIYLKARPKSNTDTPTPTPESTTSIVTESKTVTETIHYVYEDGTKAHDDFVAVPLIFTRTGVRDDSTGIVIWGSWSLAQTFQAVNFTNY